MKLTRKISLALSAGLLVTASGATAVLAKEGAAAANPVNNTTQTSPDNKKLNQIQSGDQRTDAQQAHLEALKDKLSGDRLKACQDRQADINNHIARISQRLQKHLELYSNVASRVETFYTKKNLSLANYASLVADINTKQAAAQTAINTVKNSSTSFDCHSDNPKASGQQFKTNVGNAENALKAYRTSIKNLITAIKTSLEKTTTQGAQQ